MLFNTTLPAGVRFKFPAAVPTVSAPVFLITAVLTLPAVTLLVAVIDPLVSKLPPVMLPLACSVPATLAPTGENTATLPTPLTPTVTLALADPMATLLVPLLMLATLVITPVNNAPLPKI